MLAHRCRVFNNYPQQGMKLARLKPPLRLAPLDDDSNVAVRVERDGDGEHCSYHPLSALGCAERQVDVLPVRVKAGNFDWAV